MTPTDKFLAEIDAFLERSGEEWTATRLGKEALGDPRFVFDVRRKEKPRRPSLDTAQKVLDFMAANSPRPKKRGRAA